MKLVNESIDHYINEYGIPREYHDRINDFVEKYKGDFNDDAIHALSDELGLEHAEVEEYIYDIARTHLQEGI